MSLPAAASDEDYAKAVADAVAEVNPAGPKDMGRVVLAYRRLRSMRAG